MSEQEQAALRSVNDEIERLTEVLEIAQQARDEVRAEVVELREDNAALEERLRLLMNEADRYQEVVEMMAPLGCRHYPPHLFSFSCRTRGDVPREHWCLPCKARAALDGDDQACSCGNCDEKLHTSDCAVHNEPAYPAGECDCDV